MSKAVISTTPIRSRRAVLAGIATAAALPIAAGIPTTAAASADPIFAAIDTHREAYATMQAVFAEHRQAHEVADAKVGPAHLDIPSMVEPGKTVEVSCWWDIERAVPHEQYPDLYAHHNAVLADRKAAHAAIVESLIGDEDEETNELSSAELEARDAFSETVPTTLPGLLAMIVYAGECSAHDADAFADSDCPLIETLAAAAKAISQVQS
jgi:hypothetical protein